MQSNIKKKLVKRKIKAYNKTEEFEKGGKHKMEKTKNKKGLKIFGIIVLILVIILVAIIGGTFWFVHNKLSKIQRIDINKDELNVSTEAEQKLTGYRNIALFGVDSRDDNLEKGNRSDCIIIASINNDTKEVKLISVYRDTYMQIDGHAYSYGSAQLAISTLNKNLGLNIKEFVTVNFDAVAEAVDALGGVEINIEKDELKYINNYIKGTSQSTGKASENVTKTGKQTLNGVQAVAYSRIRYTEGGDYKRAERMRTVLEAMIAKLKTKSIGEINKFVDTILPKVNTNIQIGDILPMLPNIMSYQITESIGWPYETKGITLDRWYGVPVTLENNVKRLHQEAFGETDYEVPEEIKAISNQIITKTGYGK